MSTLDPLSRETALSVLGSYAGLADDLTAFTPLPTGLYNRNARLTAGGRDLVLKMLPAGRPADASLYAVTLQARLAEAEFPCPGILPNTAGHLITPCGGADWTLQDWAEGRHLAAPDRPAHLDGGGARHLGGTLGSLHRQAGDLAGTGHLAGTVRTADLARILAATVDSARAFLGGGLRPGPALKLRLKPGKSDLEQEICRWTPQLKTAARVLADWRPPADLDTPGPGHGDINWENLLFAEDGRVTVLDFDNAGLMPTAYDAGAACAVICGANPTWQAAFADGYDDAGGATFPRENLPWLMVLKYTRSLAWQIRGRHEAADRDLARSWVAFLGENLAATLSGLKP